MHTRVDSAMDVQVLNTIMMEAKIISAAHTQEATAILRLQFKVLLGHHASKVDTSCIFVIPLSKSFYRFPSKMQLSCPNDILYILSQMRATTNLYPETNITLLICSLQRQAIIFILWTMDLTGPD